MFRIEEKNLNGLHFIKLVNTVSNEVVSIVPRFGANVNELILNKNGHLYSILDGNFKASVFKEKEIFKGTKLIPFPNRLKDGRYTFEGKQYQLPLNYPEENNACHGFIYERKFSVQENLVEKKFVSSRLLNLYNGSIPGYPFKFSVEITYCLNAAKGFRCVTDIKNLDTRLIPIGDGWHPFFKFNKQVDNLMLKIETVAKMDLDSRMIPTGKTLPFKDFANLAKIGNADFDTCFSLSQDGGIHTTEIYDPEQNLKIQLWQETGKNKYNFLQVFIPHDRESIAVEPMTCNIDAFNNKDGLIVLEPGESFVAEYGVKIA